VGSYAHQSRKATIHVVRRSWLAWVACLGLSGTQRDDPRVYSSVFRLGEQAAKPTPRRRQLLLALGTMVRKMAKTKKMTVAQKYRSLKAQTERAGMTVKEKAGKLIISRIKTAKKK
jgi:16S rRNA A1518/A1519 N6-dimethyltransferase RsmA/KsgA/DIM1 with predicted DNA glycosylase/AP lyase activity